MTAQHLNYLRRKTADESELWAADRIEQLEAACSGLRVLLTAARSFVKIVHVQQSEAHLSEAEGIHDLIVKIEEAIANGEKRWEQRLNHHGKTSGLKNN